MTRRALLPLALALLAAACTPPGGATGPLTYDQKVKRVEALTQALSLGQNEELQKSLQGAQSVGQAMSQGAFKQTTAAASGMVAAGGGNMVAAGGGNLVAAGGGNMVAAGGGNYVLRALVEDLNRAVAHDVYKLAATASLADGSSVTYDDATGELQAIQAPDAAASFTFNKAGNTRTWGMNLTKSPDGTVGTLLIEIAADTWVDQIAAPAAYPDPTPTFAPFDGSLDEEAEDEEGNEDYGNEDYGDDFGYGLQQAMGEPPVKIFGGQQPDFNTVSRVRFKADFKAQGQDNLRMVVDALLDEWAPVQGARVPGRFGLNFDVASLGVQTDTRIGWGTLAVTSKGGFKIRTKEAPETFTYALDLTAKTGAGKLDLTSETARMRFSAETRQGAQPVTGLYDVDNGQKLADLVPSATKPGQVEIRFTDGRVLQWDPASGQTTTIAFGPSTRPSSAAATATPAASPSFLRF